MKLQLMKYGKLVTHIAEIDTQHLTSTTKHRDTYTYTTGMQLEITIKFELSLNERTKERLSNFRGGSAN
jgi:hypothetical protein